jgi:uncharacterized protein (DUF58 family)
MSTLTLKERLDPRRFLRGAKPVDGPITLTHERIYIVPNRAGFALAVLLLVQWLAAINYNNNLGFILTFLLAAVAMLALLHGYRNLAGLKVRARRGQPVFAGETARFGFAIENPSPLSRYGIRAKLKGAEPACLDLGADGAGSVELRLPAPRRGWLDPGTLTVYTEFPLGIFYAWSPLNFTERLLVYPKPAAERLPFPVSPGQGQGRQRQNEDFYGFQAYRPGDPLRHLHWKGIAKGQEPSVKQYSGEQAEDLWFIYEQTPGADSEARLSRLCRWVLDAEAGGLRYGLILPGASLAPRGGAEHCRHCLEALARFGS